MRRRPRQSGGGLRQLANDPVLVGAIALLVAVIAVFLSYNANTGLPFVPTYQITVDVPDAAELTKSSEVRVGGARVGQVVSIDAQTRRHGTPYAQLKLKLQPSTKVPIDTRTEVKPRSILGAKYLALELGHSRRTVPAGGVLAAGASKAPVELSDAFNVFGRSTTKGIQNVITDLGDVLAGRGQALNDTLGGAATLLPGLQRVLQTLVEPRTGLARFVRGAAEVTTALAPQSQTLVALIDHAATTFAAIDAAGNSLGRALEQLPGTEAVGTTTLTHLTPVLADAASLARAIRPATALLPTASRQFATALRGSLGPLRGEPTALADVFSATLRGIDGLAAFRAFVKQDLGSLFLTSTVLGASLKAIMPAQISCNVAGLWTRNLASTVSEGDSAGSWVAIAPVFAADQTFQQAKPSADLHDNFYPTENASQCESGNEPYLPGQKLGNPAGAQSTHVELTAPPASATAAARQAGLLDRIPGSVQP
ncbi:MAG: Mammalian cell entry related domain protein [Solirubrobacterales bacterium]|nr:Mammalian cell entry related domain protein [Solirubrobacterales bacterium]